MIGLFNHNLYYKIPSYCNSGACVCVRARAHTHTSFNPSNVKLSYFQTHLNLK